MPVTVVWHIFLLSFRNSLKLSSDFCAVLEAVQEWGFQYIWYLISDAWFKWGLVILTSGCTKNSCYITSRLQHFPSLTFKLWPYFSFCFYFCLLWQGWIQQNAATFKPTEASCDCWCSECDWWSLAPSRIGSPACVKSPHGLFNLQTELLSFSRSFLQLPFLKATARTDKEWYQKEIRNGKIKKWEQKMAYVIKEQINIWKRTVIKH